VSCILGLDYGRRYIGVAVSDPLGLTAQPVETWNGIGWEQAIVKILELIEQKEIERIVIGLPLTLSGHKGCMAKEVERFARRLVRQIRIPVTLWDERYTSVQAQRISHGLGKKPSRQKEKVNLIASVLLLQNYLDYQKGSLVENQGEKD
jgi:putative Holliday junction resolvase